MLKKRYPICVVLCGFMQLKESAKDQWDWSAEKCSKPNQKNQWDCFYGCIGFLIFLLFIPYVFVLGIFQGLLMWPRIIIETDCRVDYYFGPALYLCGLAPDLPHLFDDPQGLRHTDARSNIEGPSESLSIQEAIVTIIPVVSADRVSVVEADRISETHESATPYRQMMKR